MANQELKDSKGNVQDVGISCAQLWECHIFEKDFMNSQPFTLQVADFSIFYLYISTKTYSYLSCMCSILYYIQPGKQTWKTGKAPICSR